MMGFHPQIRIDLENIRKYLKINTILYNEIFINNDRNYLGSFSGYINRLIEQKLITETQSDKSLKFSGALIKRYGLTRKDYLKSIEIYLLTDVFPVKYGSSKISFYPTNHFENQYNIKTENISLIKPKATDAIMLGSTLSSYSAFPNIQITHKIKSPHELTNWIKLNWGDIKKETDKLSDIKFVDINIDRLATGIWLWDLKHNKKWSLDKIDREITKLSDQDDSFWGVFNDDENMYPPSRTQCSDLIINAQSYMNSFLPSEILE